MTTTALFESFVGNFYQEELRKRDPEARIVGSEWIEWAGEALTRNYDYDQERIDSANLYRIFSYVRNLAQRSPEYEHCEGMLLCPAVEPDLRLQYTLPGRRVTGSTIDLSQDRCKIHRRLVILVAASQPGFPVRKKPLGGGQLSISPPAAATRSCSGTLSGFTFAARRARPAAFFLEKIKNKPPAPSDYQVEESMGNFRKAGRCGMMPDINAEKSAEGSVMTARQKLLLKRILVELLSGPGVSGRSIRLTTKP